MVICSKAGERPRCTDCEHSSQHVYNPLKGCEAGRCFPDTVTGDDEIVKNFIPCIDVGVSSEVAR